MKKRTIGFVKSLFMLIALMAVASVVLNAASPWKGDNAARVHMQGYFPLAIGGSSVGLEIQSRSYALIPLSFSPPKMLFVSESKDGSFTANSDQFAFWLFGAAIMYGWYLIIISANSILRTNILPGRGLTKT